MTPNTFEALVLQGLTKLEDGATIKYGAGYFDQIKKRNSNGFVSMSVDVEHGVSPRADSIKKEISPSAESITTARK
jgi:hypothetical protein